MSCESATLGSSVDDDVEGRAPRTGLVSAPEWVRETIAGSVASCCNWLMLWMELWIIR